MKSEVTFFILLLFNLFSIYFAIHLKHTKLFNANKAYKLFVCKSLNNKKLFLTFKPLNKSNRYRCKQVSSNRVKEYLKISPKKIREYYRHKRIHSKRVHKLEIKRSILYINILSKYLDNYICYSLYKKFKKFKCTQQENRCKRIFRDNNFQIYSSVDMINIFKKLSETISTQRAIKQFKHTVLILNVGQHDLDWGHYIFDTLHKKVRIFNDFDVVLFKTQGRMYLYRFSSRFYRIQLSNLKLNKDSFKRRKKENFLKHRKRFVRLRKIIKSTHSNTRQSIIRNKLTKIQNKINSCKAYQELFNHFSQLEYKKYRLLYYMDPFIDIQFGFKHIRVHYVNRLITFKILRRKKANVIKKLKLNKEDSFTSYVNGFLTNSKRKVKPLNKGKNKKKGLKNEDTNNKSKAQKNRKTNYNAKNNDSSNTPNEDMIDEKTTNNQLRLQRKNRGPPENLSDHKEESYSSFTQLPQKKKFKDLKNETQHDTMKHEGNILGHKGKDIFLETGFNEMGLPNLDNDLTAPERIIYKNGSYNDREEFLNSLLNYKVKPSARRKIFNLDEKKSIKLYQDPQDYYEKKFDGLDDINKRITDT